MANTLSQTFGRTYTQSITGQKTATRVYCFFLDSPVDDLNDVISLAITAGLPALADPYSNDSSELQLVATKYTPKEISREKAYYNIQVDYASNTSVFYTPVDRPWIITFGTIKEEYLPDYTLSDATLIVDASVTDIDKIADDIAILNTAGDVFDPSLTDTRNITTIDLRRNFYDINDIGTVTDITDLIERINTVNSDTVKIADITGKPFQFLIEDITIQNVNEQGEDFYAVNIRIQYNPRFWMHRVLNAGWNQNVGGNLVGILNDVKGPISLPWLLDANGLKVQGANPAARAAQAIYRGFITKDSSDFADMDLPEDYGSSVDLPIT
jgi:hypothetical protein